MKLIKIVVLWSKQVQRYAERYQKPRELLLISQLNRQVHSFPL